MNKLATNSPQDSAAPQETVVAWNRSLPQRAILFVDDDEAFLSLCARRFESTDYLVYTADSADNALAVLACEKIDIVISDMCMPGTSGAELLHEVRSRYPSVVRVIVSGRFDFTDTLEAINTGRVDHYVTKPFNDRELKLLIYRSLMEKERREASEEREKQRRENAKSRARELGRSVMATRREAVDVDVEATSLVGRLVSGCSPAAAVTAQLSTDLARQMGMRAPACTQIHMAALLQDFFMEDDSAAGGNTHDHPQRAAALLDGLDHYQVCADIIRCHHERFDGTGYPNKLCGTAIPKGARILSVANAYLKLRSDCGLDHAEAVELLSATEVRYDPSVLRALSRLSRTELYAR